MNDSFEYVKVTNICSYFLFPLVSKIYGSNEETFVAFQALWVSILVESEVMSFTKHLRTMHLIHSFSIIVSLLKVMKYLRYYADYEMCITAFVLQKSVIICDKGEYGYQSLTPLQWDWSWSLCILSSTQKINIQILRT